MTIQLESTTSRPLPVAPDAVADELAERLASLRERNAELARQLTDSRTVGMAIGIVADKLKITVDHAERILQTVAADVGQSIADIAAHLVNTGRLP